MHRMHLEVARRGWRLLEGSQAGVKIFKGRLGNICSLLGCFVAGPLPKFSGFTCSTICGRRHKLEHEQRVRVFLSVYSLNLSLINVSCSRLQPCSMNGPQSTRLYRSANLIQERILCTSAGISGAGVLRSAQSFIIGVLLFRWFWNSLMVEWFSV